MCKAISTEARYQSRKGSYDLGRWTFEGSRPAVSLFIHAALHCIGERGYEFLINRGIQTAQHFAQQIQNHSSFELLHPPQTNIVSYRYLPQNKDNINEINTKLQKTLYHKGKSFVSRTILRLEKEDIPIVALRAVFANPKTTFRDIKEIIEEQLHYGGEN